MTYFRRLMTSICVTLLALLVPFSVLADSGLHPDRMATARAHSAGYISKYALNETVRQLAYQSKIFQWQLERELNRSYLDGTSRERRANELSVNFRGAAENLHSLYAVGRTVDNNTEEAATLLQLGNDMDDFVSRSHLSRATMESWVAMRCKLSVLADVYDDGAADDPQDDEVSTAGRESSTGDSSQARIWRWPF